MQHYTGGDAQTKARRLIRQLYERYGWTAVAEEELAARLEERIGVMQEPALLERTIINHYTCALYETCRQSEDNERRERGYHDLFRYLYRIAYQRWPDMAETLTQHALQLVFTQLDQCREPVALLAFASFKLLQAHTDSVRSMSRDEALEDINSYELEDRSADILAALEQTETLEVLLAALQRLRAEMRQVIYLKFFAAMSDDAISRQLGISISNVRTLRSRGLARLRDDQQLRAYLNLQ